MTAVSTLVSQGVLYVARATAAAQESPSASSASPVETPVESPQQSKPPGNNQGNDNSGNNGAASSPLLFFIALGFGVVFTNLWIIVGVKYCFRYNARNRARMNEEGEPINLETVRPHRRRREKKLMTMDEVNEKFPMMKYKNWVSERAREGLPTAGGVSIPVSRANSLRNAEGIIPDINKDRSSIEDRRASDTSTHPAAKPVQDVQATKDTEKTKDDVTVSIDAGQTSGAGNTTPQGLQRVPSDDDVDDDHIDAALPPDCITSPGDTCAICIDTLEDDDDVRGLTCGHAFHAVCLDPWLTSRRACCPLCKADYFTPKPRVTPETIPVVVSTTNNPTSTGTNLDPRSNTRLNLPGTLRSALLRNNNPNTARSGASSLLRFGNDQRPRRANRTRNRASGQRQQVPAVDSSNQSSPALPPEEPPAAGTGVLSSFRRVLRLGGRHGQQSPNETSTVTTTPTPSQLESGNRPAQTATQ
ncbi:hypothetical protein CDD81_4399 [Ophiocordyceps australis]|uniref:RING-type domain-containing protein n=1 Tax=Ophiocordyceps australis TaxID=1399860 RepID=A0A2C5YJ42_9HYPO|nr:hypothetical protein CDD81_4399 [Ophiocordyceps australis]